MIGTGRRLRGVLALAALLALVFAVPVALLAWGGNPIPSSSPTSWLREPLSTDAVLEVLVVVMWLAWGHFVISVVRELAAVRHDRSSRPTVAATSHPLARRLVASVVLLVGTAGIGAQTAQAAQSHAPTSSVSGRTAGHDPVVDLVRAGQQDAASTRQSGHTALAHELKGHAGTRHQLGLSYRVQPPHGRHHDSLWDIAERMLGDGRRWTDLYELNKDHVQNDGSRLQDADLIYPGWHLVMPDDATGVDVRGLPAHHPVSGVPDASAPTSPETTSSESGPDRSSPSTDSASGPSSHRTALGAGLGTLGGLVAAGLMLGLRRRRGWDGGPPPDRGSGVEDDVELALAADTASADVADRGLRQLSAHLTRPSMVAPTLRAVRVDERTFTATFAQTPEHDPPPRWRVLGDGRVWSADVGGLMVRSQSISSTYGHVVTIGRDHGQHVLLDPTGSVVRFAGDRQAVVDTLRSAVVDLATHSWSDDITVVAIGFDDDLRAASADRVVQPDEIHDLADVVLEGRSVVVVSTTEVDSDTIAYLRDRTSDLSILCATAARDDADVAVEAQGRLTSPRYAIFAEASRLDAATAARVLARYAVEPGRASEPPVFQGFSSRLLDPSAPTAGTVRILGPLRVTGSGVVEQERADLTREIIAYLALHPEGVHPNVLSGSIWPRGVDDDVLDVAMQRVQTFLAAPHVPGEAEAPGDERDDRPPVLVQEAGRWRLDLAEVRVDWQVFRALVATAPRDADPAGRLFDALRLVEGPPLTGLPAGRYAWLAAMPIGRDMNLAIVQVAQAASSAALQTGDRRAAAEALRSGLRAVPAGEPLWQALLRLSSRDGDDRIRQVADEMYSVLRRHGSPLGSQATTDELVRELLPSYEIPRRGRILTA